MTARQQSQGQLLAQLAETTRRLRDERDDARTDLAVEQTARREAWQIIARLARERDEARAEPLAAKEALVAVDPKRYGREPGTFYVHLEITPHEWATEGETYRVEYEATAQQLGEILRAEADRRDPGGAADTFTARLHLGLTRLGQALMERQQKCADTLGTIRCQLADDAHDWHSAKAGGDEVAWKDTEDARGASVSHAGDVSATSGGSDVSDAKSNVCRDEP